MENFIKHLEIDNFKSIRHLEIDGLNRINLFIGRPNVGKSNILEAISSFSVYQFKKGRKLTDLIRLQQSLDIFHDGDSNKIFRIDAKNNNRTYSLKVAFDKVIHEGGLIFYFPNNNTFRFDSNLELLPYSTISRQKELSDFIRKYDFNNLKDFNKENSEVKISYLSSPFGENLEYVLELLPELRKTYAHWFSQYGLKLVLDRTTHSIKVLKEKGDEVFILPYSSIADTLQRIIFYKTAVASNENSVLIFEEPEAHSFPPYIIEFTQEVIYSKTNQFFIATHSPIVVNDFLENAIDDLAIFMVDFKDGQTVVRPLSKEEIREVYENGVDLFFNNEAYLA